MATQKTSALTTSNKFRPLGFSLLEILIVLGILAALAAFAIPRINFKQGNLKSALRQLGVLSREVRQMARIKQATYRVVFDLGSNPVKYWVEYSNGNSVGDDSYGTSAFSKDEHILKSDKSLPPGITIEAIETNSYPRPKSAGLAYIYYWPTGLTDAAVIRLKNLSSGKSLSLVIQPLTGRAEFFEQEIQIQDILIP
jgi:prepilin-type N-terminal cleavage/methylation domain-containing protein